jgi:hypothetical protein
VIRGRRGERLYVRQAEHHLASLIGGQNRITQESCPLAKLEIMFYTGITSEGRELVAGRQGNRRSHQVSRQNPGDVRTPARVADRMPSIPSGRAVVPSLGHPALSPSEVADPRSCPHHTPPMPSSR